MFQGCGWRREVEKEMVPVPGENDTCTALLTSQCVLLLVLLVRWLHTD